MNTNIVAKLINSLHNANSKADLPFSLYHDMLLAQDKLNYIHDIQREMYNTTHIRVTT